MPRKTTTAPRKTVRTEPVSAPALPRVQTPPELDTAYFATLIDERIDRTREQIDTLNAVIREVTLAAKDIPADDEHDPEGTTVSVERANEVALLAAAETSLIELLDARVRLDAGAYGICERCGNPIPAARLEIRPETRFCVSCAAARRR
ncbi:MULTISPECIES: TraR/DksA family transcriptional regulator [unclassified Arthrobacter]|uniref:TraR/DksA family transcriptional regulator n=1 Tax=unclassified Arthrobacter TaxID=235627 RepID=UPI001D152A83|nr:MULTISPECIES: TraR/DksA family transcriptional regulator [unclassified Arthrobacter]MCC3280685.1 TraR/DksA C4-type zinc finger protein [Arthrobacter sp. zg-Y40]MCC9178940.1 TraR/DksA C4-type zinc finger protein [Arthrobacter sp. zg-Y750]MCC3276988.1 TraR/DksA C4-type zinc finger protein [Arthrobacter sp. zg-Y20]MDK1317149.1 TraR/DksA family transcriptional regulator [Arthrobacter sp. zg.Y20]WIB07247.1 TraR/DksA family transcriptional regulator [Arthrobacter sp. zg-Y20]